MSDDLPIQIPQDRIAAFCRANGVRRLSLFGSVLRSDFRPDSDLDVLVEFEPGRTPGLAFFRMQTELSLLLGQTVDLNTLGFLSRQFRDEVLRESRTLYLAA